MHSALTLTIITAISMSAAVAAPTGFNYDEAMIPPYTLPNPLITSDGRAITTAADWLQKQRPELLALIEREMFGRAPARPALSFKIIEPATPALDGRALRQQISISLNGKLDGPAMDMILYRPAATKGPVPVVYGLNFEGNQGVAADPAIRLCRSWQRDDPKKGVENNKVTEKSRGRETGRWQVEYAISRGYAVASICYADIDPDTHDRWKNGAHALFPEIEAQRDGATWGSIAAWAWGMSIGLDYLSHEKPIDSRRIICQGHSRLGKTALWAGAMDERFAMIVSNDSGAGGAALNKRIFGETVARLNTSFPHWFCGNFTKYSDNEAALPFDSHTLVSLLAPRPVLITSATKDEWADPKGEFLGGLHASPVYKLFANDGMAATEQPAAGKLISSRIGYFLRAGEHDVTRDDWQAYLDFADKHLK